MSTIEQAIQQARISETQWNPPVSDPLADAILEKRRKKETDDFLAEFERCLTRAMAAQKENSEPKNRLPEFPIEALPPQLRAWVQAESTRTQTPIDVAAMLSLAASSAAIARKIWIEARPGKKSPVNLYVGLMCDGADRNGEVMAAAIRPLRELEREEIAEHPKEKALDDRMQKTALEEVAYHERLAQDDEESDEELKFAINSRAEIEARVPLQWPRRILDEVNARTVTRELGRHSRIALFSNNGDIFRQLISRMSASRDRLIDLLHIGHAADEFVATMEHERLASVISPAITCASIFDSSMAAAIAGKRSFRERSLLARFLFVAPQAKIGRREIAPPPMPEDVSAEYRDGIRKLADREAACLELSQDADVLLRAFEAEIESQLGEGGRLAPIKLWADGLKNQVVRIAAILHAWKSDEKVVFKDSIEAAIVIGRYLLPHAAHLLETMSVADDDCDDTERTLLHFARVARSFSARDAFQHLRRTFLSVEALSLAFAGLVQRGYLRRLEGEPTDIGRPPSDRFELAELRFWNDVSPAAPIACDVAPVVEIERAECTQNPAAAPPANRKPNRAERRREQRKGKEKSS